MQEFFKQAGKMALGSRIRLLGEKITGDAAEIYSAYDTNLKPKWFPVFYTLAEKGECTASEITEAIGHSHVSVSKIIGEMAKAGLIKEKKDKHDGRRTTLSLSPQGKTVQRKIQDQYRDVNAAIEELSWEASHDLWAALGEWDELLAKKSLKDRVLENKIGRETDVKIAEYKPKYREAFVELNRDWIETYFKLEKPDLDALRNPEKYILDRGGCILVALLGTRAVGVCALLKIGEKTYELAKMAVDRKVRGKGVGYILGRSILTRAREMGAARVYLESNKKLKPAIALYHKLGFRDVRGKVKSPYERANVFMECFL